MFLIYILIFIFGLCIGSFLNVVILRLRTGEEFVKGRSHCPQCGHVLKWYENVPLLSFIILRGKCSACQQKISWQYPIVEFVTGILFLISFIIVFSFDQPSLASFFSNEWVGGININIYSITLLLYYFITISFLILIFVFDLKYYLIPDKITLPAIITLLIFQAVLLILKNNSNYSLLITHYSLFIFSAIIISGFFWLQYILSRGKWIGGGDIRLGFLMGLILGWPLGLVALSLAYILGAIAALPLLVLRKKTMKSEVPFGVFLTTATFIAMFWGNKILDWYLSLF